MKRQLIWMALVCLLLGGCAWQSGGTGETAGPAQSLPALPEDSTPAPTETEPPEPVVATLAVCGDVMSHMPQTNDALTADGDYDYGPCLQYIAPWLQQADYAVANLETVLGGGPYHGFPLFNSPDGLAYSLKEAGIDLLSTANNHCMDQGYDGLCRTLDVLDEAGLSHVGTWRTQEEAEESTVVVADVGGISVAFLSYTYSTNGLPVASDKDFSVSRFNLDYMTTVNTLDEEKVASDLEKAKALDPDLIAVMIHWGIEYRTSATAYQEEVADFLFDHGADLVLGGHPHVMEPMETRELADGRTGFLCYSLGNFMSAQYDQYTDTTAVLMLELTKDAVTGETSVTGVSYVPLLMVNRGKGSDPRFLLMDAPRAMAEYEAGGSEYVTASVYDRLRQAREDCAQLLGMGRELTPEDFPDTAAPAA